MGVIDWQGATIRPLLEITIPGYLKVDQDIKGLVEYTNDFADPMIPSNLDSLDPGAQTQVRNEVRRMNMMRQYLSDVRNLRPGVYQAMRHPHMEFLRSGIYYSSHSWSDGLPLLRKTLMEICDAYGTVIPVNPSYPVCPISFDAQELADHAKDYNRVVWVEAKFEAQLRARLATSNGITLHGDMAVNADDFEEAQKVGARLLERVSHTLREINASQADVEKVMGMWPLREGRFDTLAKFCNGD